MTTAPRIDREALHSWIERRCDLIESTPVPRDLLDDLDASGSDEKMTLNDIDALWVGAGLASQVGMALALDPAPWVTHWPVNTDR